MQYTSDQLRRRNQSLWTPVQAVAAAIQFVIFIISVGLVIRFFATGQGYEIATVFGVTKVLLLYFMTVTGMAWEDEVFGQLFLAKEFFWEDIGNLLSLSGNTVYLATLLLGLPKEIQMIALCVALATYVINFAQFARRGMKSARQKRASAAAVNHQMAQ
jgi:3-vinyl bacteriochlorophyllide hydratase